MRLATKASTRRRRPERPAKVVRVIALRCDEILEGKLTRDSGLVSSAHTVWNGRLDELDDRKRREILAKHLRGGGSGTRSLSDLVVMTQSSEGWTFEEFLRASDP